MISTRQDKNSHKHNHLFVHTQNCNKKQYFFPQLGGGITQPHVIQSTKRFIHSSHNHKQWTIQVSGSKNTSLLRPVYWVINRRTDVAPVLGRGTDLSCTLGTGNDGELTVQSKLQHTHSYVQSSKIHKNWHTCRWHVTLNEKIRQILTSDLTKF